MSNLYLAKTRRAPEPIGLDKALAELRTHFSSNRQLNTQAIAKSSLSLESLSGSDAEQFSTAVESMRAGLEHMASQMGSSVEFTQAQKDSATVAGLFAGDVQAYLSSPIQHSVVSTESLTVVNSGHVSDAFDKRNMSMEAYDEKANKDSMLYTVAYNMAAARQDAFCEAFFKTIVVSPDMIGYSVSVRLVQVYEEVKRNISGALNNFGKKNIIRALVDATILKNDQTRVIPVVRPQSAALFVDPAVIPVRTLVHEGESIQTAPLKMNGRPFNLIDASQTEALIANGLLSESDALDPAVTLQKVYAKIGNDVLRFDVSNQSSAPFLYAQTGLNRAMNLNFRTTSLLVSAATKNDDDSALDTLAAVVSGNYLIRIGASVTGNVDLQTSATEVFSNSLRVESIQNSAGEFLDLTIAPALAIATAINGGAIIGYDLSAFRTNSNRRQRGQLLDTNYFTQVYPVPLRSPITVIRPPNSDGSNDSSDLAALITATHIRTINAGVDALLNAARMLSEYVDARDTAGLGPDIMGIGRHVVRPTFLSEVLDMSLSIDSLRSQDRAKDIQQLIVSKVRSVAYRLYRDSEYKPAADALSGGFSKAPVVVLGTDLVLSRYLMVDGDLRTLGSDFDVQIVSSSDSRVRGKIFIAFTLAEGADGGAPHPLQFGNMAWKPEATFVMPTTSRGGQISKELTVQPSFLHIVNCPVLGVVEVRNIPAVEAGKVAIDFNEV